MAKYKLKCVKSEFMDIANEHIIGPRAKRNREILFDCKIDGLTYAEAAEKYKMSVRQISTIISDCMKILQPYLPS